MYRQFTDLDIRTKRMTTAPRASAPKPPGRVKRKRMWGVFLLGDRLMEVQGRKNPLPGALKQRGFSIRPVLVTWSSPLKRTKARKGRGR